MNSEQQPPWWKRLLILGFSWQINSPLWSWFKPNPATERQLFRLYIIALVADSLVIALLLFGLVVVNLHH